MAARGGVRTRSGQAPQGFKASKEAYGVANEQITGERNGVEARDAETGEDEAAGSSWRSTQSDEMPRGSQILLCDPPSDAYAQLICVPMGRMTNPP